LLDSKGRYSAEDALRRSEEQYRTLFESMDQGFCVIEVLFDDTGRPNDWLFIEVNPAFERHNGLHDATGKRILELVPDIEPVWFERYGEVALTGKPLRFTQQSTALRRWFDVNAFRVGGNDEHRVAVLFTDATDLTLTEMALRESQHELKQFFDCIPTLAWVANADGWVTSYNQRWYKYTGKSAQEMEGWGWQTVHDPEVLPMVMERWTAAIANQEPFEMVFPLRGADGTFRHFLTRVEPVRNKQGEVVRWFGTNTDVDDMRRTRMNLAAERSRLSAIVENIPLGLVFADATGQITGGNAQAEKLMGHPILHSPDVESYREWVAYHPDGRRVEGREYPLARSLADGGVHQGEYLYERGDGRKVWLEFTSAPILGSEGNMIGAVVATSDIDARKRAEEALVRSEKLAIVGRMAATISHEINNPLEAVTNLLYLIRTEKDSEVVRTLARTAEDELSRVAHVVTHTLRFNRQSHAPATESLSKLLDSSLAIFEGRFRLKGVKLVREQSGPDGVLCFGSEVRQVFANLVGNALDAIDGGGVLFLRMKDQLHWRTGERGVRVTIADTGQGMSQTTLESLFQPFYTTKGASGTGLGLWVSREILERHHARVKVRSRQAPSGGGTVFYLWFPSTQRPKADASSR
jgi:PAS domain S-box-containing protein